RASAAALYGSLLPVITARRPRAPPPPHDGGPPPPQKPAPRHEQADGDPQDGRHTGSEVRADLDPGPTVGMHDDDRPRSFGRGPHQRSRTGAGDGGAPEALRCRSGGPTAPGGGLPPAPDEGRQNRL